ncbi:uncharacterized protein PGTG_08864 [Puccinia graminis f. sp. tritici CRL 75-36-700-3]|uniref:Uncharacterized protein n=1 Tax=Puccinia graminis f. sp. tritici (strain CRL 75-36-700-3 / race SCCL) TaxID=418459 RepID=E3KED5_PUCGT|nr:uncharacterized protein PGTG_08864 [Puccinia graminis f. sp. tritici CRL 75-36-700-3]EFP82668.2 hypothetical protein PGTG_08864 [Puccinia graminis f. sp. tritici CRL 75-36-700-3]
MFCYKSHDSAVATAPCPPSLVGLCKNKSHRMLQDAKSPRTVQIAPGIGIHHIFIVPGYQLDNQRAPFCSFVLVDRSVSDSLRLILRVLIITLMVHQIIGPKIFPVIFDKLSQYIALPAKFDVKEQQEVHFRIHFRLILVVHPLDRSWVFQNRSSGVVSFKVRQKNNDQVQEFAAKIPPGGRETLPEGEFCIFQALEVKITSISDPKVHPQP